jgi:hypothetical protein
MPRSAKRFEAGVGAASAPPRRRRHAGARSAAGGAMYDDVLTAADRRERLGAAVAALADLDRSPQERLDRALSLFRRAFRDEPAAGPVRDAFRRVYEAIGDPPYGTPIAIGVDALSADERAAVATALVDLLVAVVAAGPDVGAGSAAA